MMTSFRHLAPNYLPCPRLTCAKLTAAILMLLLGQVCTSTAQAQTETAQPQTDEGPAEYTAETVPEDGETVSEEQLQIELSPLTADQLVVEADAWLATVQAKMHEIADARIALLSAADADRQQQTQALSQLQDEKTQLVDRLNVVLRELTAKGGDATAYESYVTALPGIAVDVSDASAFFTMIKNWLVSEQGGQRWGWNILKFLAILLAFYIAARIVSRLVRHAAERLNRGSELLVRFLEKFTRQVIMIVGLIVALAALEVNISPLLAAVGAAGFVVAFALQGTLSNFASGMLILAYRPFDVGDVIEAAGISGIVDSVTLFSTHVRTFDNKVMIVPNNDIWGGTITNATASDTRRVDMTFGIGYDDDVAKAREILENILKNHELVLHDPAPTIKLNELGDSSVNIICRPWTKTADYWTVFWDVTRQVKEEFDRNNISFPFPQRDVHVFQHAGA